MGSPHDGMAPHDLKTHPFSLTVRKDKFTLREQTNLQNPVIKTPVNETQKAEEPKETNVT